MREFRIFDSLGQGSPKEAAGVFREFIRGHVRELILRVMAMDVEVIALHRLNVPNTLNRNLLSTNAIENSFRNTRRKLGRVTRFRAETDQATRWLAFSLLEAEKGFRRITGYAHLGSPIAALERQQPATVQADPRSGSPPSPTAQAESQSESLEIGTLIR